MTDFQIRSCVRAWEFLCSEAPEPLNLSEAARHGSRTRYDEARAVVILGADVYPGPGPGANARMSVLACLAHELAHLRRHRMGFDRPFLAPDAYLDEAEASIFASFETVLTPVDREDLVEDARDRLIDWLALQAA